MARNTPSFMRQRLPSNTDANPFDVPALEVLESRFAEVTLSASALSDVRARIAEMEKGPSDTVEFLAIVAEENQRAARLDKALAAIEVALESDVGKRALPPKKAWFEVPREREIALDDVRAWRAFVGSRAFVGLVLGRAEHALRIIRGKIGDAHHADANQAAFAAHKRVA